MHTIHDDVQICYNGKYYDDSDCNLDMDTSNLNVSVLASVDCDEHPETDTTRTLITNNTPKMPGRKSRAPHIAIAQYWYSSLRMTIKPTTLLFPLSLLSLIWLSCHLPLGVDAFASNLVVTTIGCMTDLSTDEIIMNNEVKFPEDSDFPKMHLVVLDDDDNHMESPYKYHSQELSLAFINPYSKSEFSDDLQFVMEVEGPASFIDGGAIGCNNNIRVSSSLRDYNGRVKLEVHDLTASLKIWAGWATGQESVRLVPDLILEPGSGDEKKVEKDPVPDSTDDDTANAMESGDTSGNTAGGGQDPNQDEKKESESSVQDVATPKRKPKKNSLTANDVPAELDNVAKRTTSHMKEKIAHKLGDNVAANRNGRDLRKPGHDQQLDIAAQRAARHQQEANEDSPPDDGFVAGKNIEKAMKMAERMNQEHRERQERRIKDVNVLQAEGQKRRRDLEAQMRRNYSRADNLSDFDMIRFAIGCAFFVLSIGGIVIGFGRKRDKGRRDL